MGIIQNAINQTLQTAGIAARLAPGYETKAQLADIKKQQASITKQAETAELHGKDARDPEKQQYFKNIRERGLELQQKRFELEPTRENFNTLIRKKGGYQRMSRSLDLIARREQALQQSAETQDAQLNLEESFKNYVSNLETSLGGKVGDLPPHVQALVAQQLKEQGGKKDGE